MEPTPINIILFCKEVSTSQSVWTLFKDGNVVAVADLEGVNTIPFWSSCERVVNFLKKIDEFDVFTPLEIPWYLFKAKWVSDLKTKKMITGVNWTGSRFECQEEPDNLIETVESFEINIT
ncbi:DUF2750 domain-containing protein [Thermodesulfobacteriota bacterium]